jgi:cell wall-associated NlpC family hydrolase
LLVREVKRNARLAAGLLAAVCALPPSAAAQTGGASPGDTSPTPTTTTTPTTTPTAPTDPGCTTGVGGVGSASQDCGPTGRARLLATGQAVAPVDAPGSVKRAIRYANMIVDLPYRLGGGHVMPWRLDTAYDCSGTVSWALHGARLLGSPLPSGSLSKWGLPARGRWISVYANGGHAYAVIAGLRLDTSMVPGNGPGWSRKMRSGAGYTVRHPKGF